MSHELNSGGASLTEIVCPLEPPFTDGALYVLRGHSQGTLGLVDVYAQATSDATLSADVHLYHSDEGGTVQLFGIYDWDACNLIYVRDMFNNEVYGAAIDIFPWYVPTYQRNFVGLGSSLVPDVTGLATVTNNRLDGVSFLDLSASEAAVEIVNNTLLSGSVVTIDGEKAISLQDNFLAGNSRIAFGNINVLAGNTIPFEVIRCHLSGSSSINFPATDWRGGATLQDLHLASVSSIQFTGEDDPFAHEGTLLVEASSFFDESVMLVLSSSAGAGGPTYSRLTFTTESQGIFTDTGHASAVEDVVLEHGVLSAGLFSVVRIRLEDATSNLVGNVTDATKTGYVNALP